MKRWILGLVFCPSASFASAAPDVFRCINADVDQVIEGRITSLRQDAFTLKVTRTIFCTYNNKSYSGILIKINDSCQAIGPYAFQLNLGDHLVVYSVIRGGKMVPTLWLDPKTVFAFDKRFKSDFPDLQREEDEHRRKLSRSLGGAIPKGTTESLLSDADYPVASARQGHEGLVRVRLDITPEGRVGQCTIIKSTGDRTLDGATCALYTRRARFQAPQSEAEKSSTLQYRWRLPEEYRGAARFLAAEGSSPDR